MKIDVLISELKDLEARRQALDNIPRRIRELEQAYGAVRAARTDGEAVRSSGCSRREEALINNIAMRDKLRRDLEVTCRDVRRMDSALSSLPEDERQVLQRFYVCRTRDYIDRLCEELGYERSQIYKIKDNALLDLTLRLYGVAEL